MTGPPRFRPRESVPPPVCVICCLLLLLLPELAVWSVSASVSSRHRPVYELKFEVYYNTVTIDAQSFPGVTSSTVSHTCAEHYAMKLLSSFVELNTWLDGLCKETTVFIERRAHGYIFTDVVKIQTTVKLSGSENNVIILCSKKLNETLQNVTQLDVLLRQQRLSNSTISFIAGTNSCVPAEMNPTRFHLENHTWICNESYTLKEDEWACYKDVTTNALTAGHADWTTSRHDERSTTLTTQSSSMHLTVSSHVNNRVSDGSETSVHPMTSETTTEVENSPKPKFWGITSPKNVTRFHLIEGYGIAMLPLTMWYNRTALCVDEPLCEISMVASIEADEEHPELECRRTQQSIPQVALARPAYATWIHDDNYCRLRFPPNETVVSDAHLLLKAIIDHKYDGSQTRWLRLSMVKTNGTNIEKERLFEIKVVVDDQDRKSTCQSINDPHITTFDGFEYNNFYEGEFILYQHRHWPFRVHAIYQKCQPNLPASCNCAVAVQSDDDVIVVDRCYRKRLPVPEFRSRWSPENPPPMKIQLFLNGNLTQGTKIHEDADGKKYFIYLPHGAYVKVLVSGQLVNLWIVPSPNDLLLTQGLCGFYDRNKANDIQLRNGTLLEDLEALNFTDNGRPQPAEFIRDWGVDIGSRESLFRGVPARKSRAYETQRFCICGGKDDDEKAECDYAADINRCDIYQGRDITERLISQAVRGPGSMRSTRRTSRDIHDNSIFTGEEEEPVVIDKHFVPPPKYSWKGKWNDVNALDFCRKYIKDEYSIGKLCSQIPPVNFKQEITTCVEDIKITGNASFAPSARDAMKEQCIEEVQKNGSLPLDIVRSINSAICINDCSNHGQCLNGTCHCEADYGSADCSNYLRSRPYVNEIPKYGLCDVRYMKCNQVIVYGGNFIDSVNLSCHLQKCKIIGNSMQPQNETVRVRAIYITFNAVECPIPSVSAYLIRISNNGVNTSDPLLFVTFDSACDSCNYFNVSCSKKKNSCIIDDKCYREGDSSPMDGCLVCKAHDDGFQWTSVQDDSCHRAWWDSVHLPDWAVALAAAIGGSLIGVLTGFLLYRCCCRSKKLLADDDVVTSVRQDSGDCSGFETESFLHRSRGIPTFNGDPFADLDPFDSDSPAPVQSVFYNDGKGVENGVDSTTYF